VSLLWPNQHQALLSLGAEQLSIIWRTGFAKTVIAKHHETYQLIAEQPWKVALQQLDRQLKALNLPFKTQLSVTLASDLVRYIVLPAHHIAMNASEKLGYAQAAYREIYGAAADSWKISIDDTPPAQPTLACAIDISLYEALDQLAQKYQLTINTIQPYLMTTFNRLFSSIKNANASLVVVEQTRMLTLLLQNGVCQQVRSEKLTSDWQAILEQSISRDQLLTNNMSKELMIYAPALNSIKLAFSKNFTPKRLSFKTKNLVMQPDYAMLEALV
jgi:mRNA-degrading endonuclease YafQ of YafQ-DinJ toxin-antitoxin module